MPQLEARGGSGFQVSSWPAVGAVLALLALVAAWLVPWSRTPWWAVGILPVVDLAALGLSRLDSLSSGAGVLAVVPALWLGRQFGRRGAATALERVRAGWDEAERRRAELATALETIERQRRMSDAILDTVDVGLVLLDGKGRYEAMNRRH